MIKIRRALISVSDKTGVIDFAKGLSKFGVEILSTGGTAKSLREAGLNVKEVSEHTGFPEMLDGRVKTLHPKIHGGLLAIRDNPEHMEQIKKHDIAPIDMVVINLYPFEKTIAKEGVKIEEAIENIDIGGPSMLRSAAKNHQSVAVVCNPGDYQNILGEMIETSGSLKKETLKRLAVEVFEITSRYDAAIFHYLKKNLLIQTGAGGLEKNINFRFTKIQDLRYGENPHQRAAFYSDLTNSGLAKAKQLNGKELSFNNILDLNSALEIVREFKDPAAVIIKHNNPCGAAMAKTLEKAYKDAWDCDSLSAFGGVVGLNRGVDLKSALVISKSGFLECIIAPSFTKEAVELLGAKKNLRLLELADFDKSQDSFDFKKVSGGFLLQDKDRELLDVEKLNTVTTKKPSKSDLESLFFAWKVAKHVKSNAIVLARGTKTVGIGAGQMSRVDSTFMAIKKSGKFAKGSCLASDAFFPKEDAVQIAAKAGIKAIIQPGGSISDEAIIKQANKSKIPMVFTGMRHFKH